MEDFGSYKLCRMAKTASGGAIQKTLCTEWCAPFASTGINSYINFYAPMKSFINMGGALNAGTKHYPISRNLLSEKFQTSRRSRHNYSAVTL